MVEKRKKIKRKRVRKFKLLKPIEFYALLITSLCVTLFIYLIEGTRYDREQLANKAKSLVYKRALEIAEEEKAKYEHIKESDAKERHWYDTLTPKQKEAIKQEYELLKKMNN